MVTKARMIPPIRADTATINGEPQLQKKRLKTKNPNFIINFRKKNL